MNFFVPYKDEDLILVTNLKMIAKNYLKKWFFLDFISLIPFDAMFRKNNYNRLIRYSRIYLIFRVLRFAGLLKLFRFFRIHDKTKRNATYGNVHVNPSNVRMMFLLIYFLIIEHVWTCIWIMIGKLSPESKANWIYKQDMLDSSNWDLYVAALYFTFTTIITVGYGDIAGVSNIERFFCMTLMLLGCFLYSVLTGLISTIVDYEDIEQRMLNRQLALLKDLKYEYNIEKELIKQLKSYFMFNYTVGSQDYKEILAKIPNSQRIELKYQMSMKKFSEVKFLKEYLNNE
jgi:hypothetical protein